MNEDDDDTPATFDYHREKKNGKDVRQISLPDGSVRRTLATATIGFPNYYNDNNLDDDDDNNKRDDDDEEVAIAAGGALELPNWIDAACRSSTTTTTTTTRNNNNNEDATTTTTGDVRDTFEELRDVVAYIVNLFITKLDTELALSRTGGGGGATNDDEDDTHDNIVNYYRRLLEKENHLEHFHVYTKKEEGDDGQQQQQKQQQHRSLYNYDRDKEGTLLVGDNNDDGDSMSTTTTTTTTLDYHTDAGFFLAFVPAMDCHTRTIDNTSFHIRPPSRGYDDDGNSGVIIPVFDENDVIIMMGAAAEHWLPPYPLINDDDDDVDDIIVDEKWRKVFLATSHALQLTHGAHRAWYGKMHLLPMSLRRQEQKQSTSTGNEEIMFPFQLKDYNAHAPNSPVDGCGIRVEDVPLEDDAINGEVGGGDNTTITTTNVQSSRRRRRRIQHVNSPANCNNITDFFCWYQCLDIPNSSDAEANVKGGQSLYCLDPSLLSSSVIEATTPCRNGYVHNSNCIGSWQKTDANVPGYTLPYKISTEDNSESSINSIPAVADNDEYCYGGTSMYMDGFTWQGSACVIYLFRSWVLTTPIKFAFAVVGSLCLGILLEYVLRARRRVYALPPGNRRLLMSTLFYGLQLTMGYFIMLVIMTYSGPLFVSTVGGMMIGHVIFNAQDALIKRWKEKGDDDGRRDGTEDVPEAAVATASNARNRELGSYQNGTASLGNNAKDDNNAEKDLENLSDTSAKSAGIRRSVADGVTPCCQYTL